MNTSPCLGRRVLAPRAGLVEGLGEVLRDAHDLAGRAHLGPEDGVDARELGEREHRLLHRDVRRDDLLGEAELVERLARHAPWRRSSRAARRWPCDTNGTVREARGFTSST